MAGGSLGDLLVTLGLDAAEFIKGLTKAQYQAKKALDDIKEGFESVIKVTKRVAGAVGIALSVDAFKDMIIGALEANKTLGELGLRAGITGAQLSSLSKAARHSGTDLETVVNTSARLSKAFLEANEKGSKAGAVLRALGFNAQDLDRFLANPAQGLLEISKRMQDLPESGTKAAAQLLLVGRSGAQTTAFMNELAKQTELVATKTNEEIEAAKKFLDGLSDLETQTKKAKTALANAFLPTLQDVLDVILKVSAETGGLAGAVKDLAKTGVLEDWARTAALVGAALAEVLTFVARTLGAVGGQFALMAANGRLAIATLKAAKNFTTDPFARDESTQAGVRELAAAMEERGRIAKAQRDREEHIFDQPDYVGKLKTQFAATDARREATTNIDKNADARDFKARELDARLAAEKAKKAKDLEARLRAAVNDAGKKGREEKDRTAERELERLLKIQEVAIRDEQDTLKDRLFFLQKYYKEDLITAEDYYNAQILLTQNATAAQVKAIEEQIRLQEEFANRPGTKEEDKTAAKTKILDLEYRKNRLLAEAMKEQYGLQLDLTQAVKEYKEAVQDVDLQMKELLGDSAAVAAIKFDKAHEQLLTRAKLRGDTRTQEQVAFLKEQEQIQIRLSKATSQYENIEKNLAREKARIDLAERQGAITGLEALNQRSAKITEYVAKLRAQLEVEEAIAQTLAGPAREKALKEIEDAKFALEELQEQAKELEHTFRDTFTDAFASNLDGVINGTKSISKAFKDMAKSIEQDITRLASKTISEALFGSDSPASEIPKFLAGLFGGVGRTGNVQSLPSRDAIPVPGFAGGTFNINQATGQVTEVKSTLDAFVDKLGSVFGFNKASSVLKRTTATEPLTEEARRSVVPNVLDTAQLSDEEAIQAWKDGINDAVGKFASSAKAEAAAAARTELVGKIAAPEVQGSVDDLGAKVLDALGFSNDGPKEALTGLQTALDASSTAMAALDAAEAASSTTATTALAALTTAASAAATALTALATSAAAKSASKAAGGIFGSIFDSFTGGESLGTGSTQGAFVPFGGGFAKGGPITADKAYLVGEEGPELFRPHAAGTIIPNHIMQQMDDVQQAKPTATASQRLIQHITKILRTTDVADAAYPAAPEVVARRIAPAIAPLTATQDVTHVLREATKLVRSTEVESHPALVPTTRASAVVKPSKDTQSITQRILQNVTKMLRSVEASDVVEAPAKAVKRSVPVKQRDTQATIRHVLQNVTKQLRSVETVNVAAEAAQPSITLAAAPAINDTQHITHRVLQNVTKVLRNAQGKPPEAKDVVARTAAPVALAEVEDTQAVTHRVLQNVTKVLRSTDKTIDTSAIAPRPDAPVRAVPEALETRSVTQRILQNVTKVLRSTQVADDAARADVGNVAPTAKEVTDTEHITHRVLQNVTKVLRSIETKDIAADVAPKEGLIRSVLAPPVAKDAVPAPTVVSKLAGRVEAAGKAATDALGTLFADRAAVGQVTAAVTPISGAAVDAVAADAGAGAAATAVVVPFGGALAAGGSVAANKGYLVGEHGPEYFQPNAAGQIIPNSELMQRRANKQINNITITVEGSVSKSTMNQIALRTAAELQRVSGKDG